MDSTQAYQPANLMMANSLAYGVALVDGGPAHLTMPALGQTLCQIALWPGLYQPAPFGADGCKTCRRMAEVRNLAVATESLPF
jgi:hypothetical protein